MKKVIMFIFSMILCIGLITGCTTSNKESDNTSAETTPTQGVEPTQGIEPTNEVTDQEEVTPGNEKSSEVVSSESEKTAIHIAALKGPTAMGMAKIMKDNKTGEAANNYNFTIAGTADEITTGLISGDIQIAAVPCNLASVLFNRTKGGIKVAGINTLSVLYIVETGNSISSIQDLKGKTIYSTGKGTTPEYTLNYLLRTAGIDPEKDLNIEFKTEATEVAAILSESSDAIAMLPQPYVTTVMKKNNKVHIALDIAQEWEKVTTDGSSIVTGVVVVNTKFLEENEAAVQAFLDEYSASVAYVNENVEEASNVIEEFDIVKAAVAKEAIPYCNITFLEGKDMRDKISGYLNVLFEQEPKSVGGKIPEDSFYYMR